MIVTVVYRAEDGINAFLVENASKEEMQLAFTEYGVLGVKYIVTEKNLDSGVMIDFLIRIPEIQEFLDEWGITSVTTSKKTIRTRNAMVVSGFPGVGKSYFAQNTGFTVLDSDSSKFSWIREGERHPDFPNNYIQHIKDNMGKVDCILVSSHDIVRKALEENQINYTLAYPDKESKDEYLERFRSRGNDEKFISFIDANWNKFIDDIENESFPTLLRLSSGAFLKDALMDIVKECML